MKLSKAQVICTFLAAGAVMSPAMARDIKSYTFVNKTGTEANDFHVRFNINASPPTVAPAPTAHSNEIQTPAGAARGTFPRPASSGSNPGGGFTNNILDYTGPSATIRNNDQMRITVPFPNRGVGVPAEYWFTLNGGRIAGRVDLLALNENFSRDNSGLCSLDLTTGAGTPTFTASNIQVWTGLTESQVDDYANLSPGAAMNLGSATISPGGGAHFSLGSFDESSFAVVKYDMSYFDADFGSDRTAAGLVYGSAIPTPGSLALGALGAIAVFRRRRA